MTIKNFFSDKEQEEIITAIQEAELFTSGEIRVHLENTCPGNPEVQAKKVFNKLNMSQTEQRNGVLFYLAVKSRKFAVIGDEGIHQVVGKDFWEDTRNAMLEQFYSNKFKDGLIKGIELAGEKLRKHFPYQKDDVNELSDEISFTDV